MPSYRLSEPSYFGNASGLFGRALLVLILGAAAAAAGWLWFRSSRPEVEIEGGFPRVIGPSTRLRIRWSNPNGIRSATVIVRQNGSASTAFERVEPARRFVFQRSGPSSGDLAITFGKREVPALHAGRAILEVLVQSNDLRGQATRIAQELPVILEKPTVTADAKPVAFRQGGTGVVTFTVGGGWSDAGVLIGRYRFRSWPVKGQPERRVALFSYPPDLEPGTEPTLYARNEAGEEAITTFPSRMLPVRFRERTLDLTGSFVDKVLGELDLGGTGDAAARFSRINSRMRRENDAALAGLAVKTSPKRLWEGTFSLLPRGKAEAMFADHRLYRLNRQTLNREWHLGIDMASVKNAPVPAANHGAVIHTGRLGIYGNTIVIDHGIGVMSVYAHLSEIRAKPGDAVKRGDTIGLSGMTGLAGGDHLHFGMLLGGVFVDPVEWSYEHWMHSILLPALRPLE